MTDRRSILKLFGIGAAIVPVVGGIPDMDSRALIITPPTIEIPPPLRVAIAQPNWGESEVVVFIRDKCTGAATRMDCSAFITEWEREMVDVTRDDMRFRQFIPSITKVRMVATGEVRMVEL